MHSDPQGQRAHDRRLGLEKLVGAGSNANIPGYVLREPEKEAVVSRLGSREVDVEFLLGRGRVEGLGDEEEALAAPRLDDPRDEERVDETVVPPSTGVSAQSSDVLVLLVVPEPKAPSFHREVDPVKMLELLPRELEHRPNQLGTIRIPRDEGEARRRRLPLARGMIHEKVVEVAQDVGKPVGGGRVPQIKHEALRGT